MNSLTIAGYIIEQTGAAKATITLPTGEIYYASNISTAPTATGNLLRCKLGSILWWTPEVEIAFAPGKLTVTITDAPEDDGTQVYPTTPAEDTARIKFLSAAKFPAPISGA